MSQPMHPILIAGPTAAGKSALALALAEQTGGCIINADALQVYSCWQVLSARPDNSELARAPHDLYGHVDCNAEYSTGHWLRDVQSSLARAKAARQRPIIIGGTGLYFTALTQGLAEIPPIPAEIKLEGNDLREASQVETMLADLQNHDPESIAKIDTKNPVRVQRAWEVWRATGIGLAQWHARTPPPVLPRSAATSLVLDADRDWLADRIDQRFRWMLENGAIAEAEAVLNEGWQPARPAMQAIGAAEIIAYLQGEMTLDQVIERGSAHSRQYAKRQRTWFRNRLKDWQILSAQNTAQFSDEIQEIVNTPP